MGSDWIKTTISNIGRVVTGRTPVTHRQDFFGGDIPFVSPSDFDGRRYVGKTKRYLTEEGAKSVQSARIPRNSIMVTCIGSAMGKSAIADNDCVTNQQINSIVVDSETDAMFVYYDLHSREAEIRNMASGSAQPILKKTSFGKLIVALPPLPEQRAIAHILGTLDDKIELNRRMNKTLEAIARALFKSWFVDFDPVRAKMAGRDTGLPPEIAALFPDRLVASELGEIPEGWDTFALDELADHHSKTLAPLSSPESEFEHYSIPAFDKGRVPAIELGSAIKSNKTVIPDSAILLSKLNPEIPRVWIPESWGRRRQICSTEFLVFTPTGPGELSLLFSLFTEESFRAMLQSMVTGTSKSHQRVPVKALKKCVVLCGTCELFSLFERLMSPNLKSVLENRAMSRTLSDVRDALLPKLMSGELRLRDTETFLERAL